MNLIPKLLGSTGGCEFNNDDENLELLENFLYDDDDDDCKTFFFKNDDDDDDDGILFK